MEPELLNPSVLQYKQFPVLPMASPGEFIILCSHSTPTSNVTLSRLLLCNSVWDSKINVLNVYFCILQDLNQNMLSAEEVGLIPSFRLPFPF